MKRIVLAYSGGLDTSVIVKYLQETYNAEVITYTADLGQEGEIKQAVAKAKQLGVQNIIVEDLKQEFATNYIYPMLRANAVYENYYLLGTSIARPLIAKRLVEVASEFKADAIAHGATGKGNDQVRFEVNAYALNPNIQIIAPWREWSLNSRQSLLQFCQKHNIEVESFQSKNKSPYSMDGNLMHVSYEGLDLEDLNNAPKESMWRMTTALAKAPDTAEQVSLTFEKGNCIAIDDQLLPPHEVIAKLNAMGATHGIGRIDIVENRFVGIKSRGCYETPGATILLHAHRTLESIILDREVAHLKEDLALKYARIVYNGFWFAPERQMLQVAIDHSQQPVSGKVSVMLYKGNVTLVGRQSDNAIYDQNICSFEDDNNAYNQLDAAGFIKLQALRLRYQSNNK